MARKNLSPTKTELARYKAMSDMGLTANAIAVRAGRDSKTIRKYLKSEVYSDPEIMQMVDVIKEKEVSDLYLLGAKARKRLHELLDEGKTRTIETVALMDRSFQQRRLLEGQTTELFGHVHSDIEEVRRLRAEREKLKDASIETD